MTREERVKTALLSSWFLLTITTLWLLKPLRTASLLAHLGAAELPYVRFGAVLGVALVVGLYSRAVNQLSRLDVARGASAVFAVVLIAFWVALRLGGTALGGERWFVWAVFILVDVYSTVMVGIFWTYTNDVVSAHEADRLYGPIGLGGIVGGIVGGAIVDGLAEVIGAVDILLLCAALVVACGAMAWLTERTLKPPARVREERPRGGVATALDGGRAVMKSRYLLLIVGIVVAYEFAAALTDFVVSVVFERAYHEELELAQMYGRLGWIVSATALVSQVVVVPTLLPAKRVALLVPPVAMVIASIGLVVAPVVSMAVILSATDRGLNYSLQQATKETLYVPLNDTEKYKAKAFIDMLVDRGAKALSAAALIAVIASVGVSVRASLGVALVALVLWVVFSHALGRIHARKIAAVPEGADATRADRSAVDVTADPEPSMAVELTPRPAE